MTQEAKTGIACSNDAESQKANKRVYISSWSNKEAKGSL